MANWTKRDLEKQFERSQRDGWTAFFQEGSTGYDFPVAVLILLSQKVASAGGFGAAVGLLR